MKNNSKVNFECRSLRKARLQKERNQKTRELLESAIAEINKKAPKAIGRASKYDIQKDLAKPFDQFETEILSLVSSSYCY